MTGVATVRWVIDPDASHVAIEGASSLHPIRASATGLSGWIESTLTGHGLAVGAAVTGHIAIEVSRLDSGNPLIDRETRRRIDARRHPMITGDVVSGTVAEGGVLDLHGVITLKGERIEVAGAMTATDVDAEHIVLGGASTFDIRWWGLRPPRLGLLRVHPEVEVTVGLVAVATR